MWIAVYCEWMKLNIIINIRGMMMYDCDTHTGIQNKWCRSTSMIYSSLISLWRGWRYTRRRWLFWRLVQSNHIWYSCWGSICFSANGSRWLWWRWCGFIEEIDRWLKCIRRLMCIRGIGRRTKSFNRKTAVSWCALGTTAGWWCTIIILFSSRILWFG